MSFYFPDIETQRKLDEEKYKIFLKEKNNLSKNKHRNIYENYKEYDDILEIENCIIYDFQFIPKNIKKIIIKNGYISNLNNINITNIVLENVKFINNINVNKIYKTEDDEDDEDEEIGLKFRLRNKIFLKDDSKDDTSDLNLNFSDDLLWKKLNKKKFHKE